MTSQTPVTESDLHAYIDGELSPERSREVEEYLALNPQAAQKVAQYQQINEGIAHLYDPVAEEPVPAQLQIKSRGSYSWLRVAAVAAWMAIGGVIGWQLNTNTSHQVVHSIAQAPEQVHLVKPAAFAHSIYTSEERHPVEVSADQEQHLVDWLSKRLKTEIKAPTLAKHGFSLMGGRLLPSTDRMAAQFMYENKNGNRVTLYIRTGVWNNEQTAFRFTEQDGTGVFYWIDGQVAYCLVGDLEQGKLLTLSESVYPQLSI